MAEIVSMSRAEYDRLDRVNWSSLKLMARSPAHYRQALIEPPADTDEKALGRAIHLSVFEPERVRQLVAVWDGGSRRGKDWERFKEENKGRELLTENAAKRCSQVAEAVRRDSNASRYLAGG